MPEAVDNDDIVVASAIGLRRGEGAGVETAEPAAAERDVLLADAPEFGGSFGRPRFFCCVMWRGWRARGGRKEGKKRDRNEKRLM